ncbi:MAG: hypothetical protein KDA60_11450 [Planctomycetales bacterium]|nr:hypothetical protein [Planctomycetales bacterium]
MERRFWRSPRTQCHRTHTRLVRHFEHEHEHEHEHEDEDEDEDEDEKGLEGEPVAFLCVYSYPLPA